MQFVDEDTFANAIQAKNAGLENKLGYILIHQELVRDNPHGIKTVLAEGIPLEQSQDLDTGSIRILMACEHFDELEKFDRPPIYDVSVFHNQDGKIEKIKFTR